jgi:hypothetical protein
MTYDHKSLLDARREGAEFSLADINRALRASGDLAQERSDGMAAKVRSHTNEDRTSSREELVGGSEIRPQEASWQGWSKYLDKRNEQAAQ